MSWTGLFFPLHLKGSALFRRSTSSSGGHQNRTNIATARQDVARKHLRKQYTNFSVMHFFFWVKNGNTFIAVNTSGDPLPELRIQITGIHTLDNADFIV